MTRVQKCKVPLLCRADKQDASKEAFLPKSAYLVQKKCPRPPELSWKEGSFLFLSEVPFFRDKAACSEYR